MCRVSARKRGARRTGIARVDIGAPALERGGAFGARRVVVVGDIVDSAAKGVDLIHRIALRSRQDAHGEIERAAGSRGSGVDFCIVHDKIGNSQDDLRWRRLLKGVKEVLCLLQDKGPARADTRETPGRDAGNGEKYINLCETPQFCRLIGAGRTAPPARLRRPSSRPVNSERHRAVAPLAASRCTAPRRPR